tara:strand:+ start:412 stop:615 length:204 start_codon:yes stop_codon:yes gene_type:complete
MLVHMASSIPRELSDKHLDNIQNAYHATVEAFLRNDPEWIAEGLSMLASSVEEANTELSEHIHASRV